MFLHMVNEFVHKTLGKYPSKLAIYFSTILNRKYTSQTFNKITINAASLFTSLIPFN